MERFISVECFRKKGKTFRGIPRGGGGGLPYETDRAGMLVISLRGVNFGFWSRLGCSGQSANILSRKETQNYVKRNRSQIFFLTCF